MIPYRINPYISFIKSCLLPGLTQYAVFHRLTGALLEPSERVRSLLHAATLGNRISLSDADLANWGEVGAELKQLIEKEFLIPEGYDPLSLLYDQYVARPIQNPALAYRLNSKEGILVRTSMEHATYSRKRDEVPLTIEEKLSSLPTEIFLLADGTNTLRHIFTTLRGKDGSDIQQDCEFRTAVDFLTSQERQLIKFTGEVQSLADPFSCVNTVPRNLYHSDRWDGAHSNSSAETIIDFHLHGIDDAAWEFDQIEPTVNHSFRFPHEALGGLDYGSRFCLSTLQPEVIPLLDYAHQLDVLEIGGGTGCFAQSFIKQAVTLNDMHVNYHIVDLSPALMENQRAILSQLLPENRHFHQDATKFDIPGRTFDLIIANEVIADFPIASVQRNRRNAIEDKDGGLASGNGAEWEGDGSDYLKTYDLADKNAPDSFLVNAGAFDFIERAWKHLTPGGTLVISEYGGEQRYPVGSYHLNHDEFSIHFGHLSAGATKIGFQCRLLTLKEFMAFDDELLVLAGREEQILCLNHVLKNFGVTLPFAVISKSDFERQCQGIAEEIALTGYSFLPLRKGYHFGPKIEDFLVLIMNKPL